MSEDERTLMGLGCELMRIINDLRKTSVKSGSEVGYALRSVSFPGGRVHLLMTLDSDLMGIVDQVLTERYSVRTVTPSSEQN